MKGLPSLVLGIFGTLAFSWLGLAFIPNLQIGHLDPQTDEEGNDAYPAPQSGMAARGLHVYVANGCFYCHSQQVRADYAGADIDRKWGTRRSAPRDYIFDRPVELGKMRLGPDLANVGKRAPAEDENAPPNASPAAANPANVNGLSSSALPTTGAASPAGSPPAPPAASTPGSPTPVQAPPATASSPAPTAGSPAAPIAKNQLSPAAPAQSPPNGPTVANTAKNPATATLAGSSEAMQQKTAAVAGAATSLEGSPSESPPPYSVAWHHRHLYSPRSLNQDSNMPSFKFLYDKHRIGGQPSADALTLPSTEAPGEGWEIVPSYDAKCLVAYLMSLDQSHQLAEVKSAAPPAPPVPGKAAK